MAIVVIPVIGIPVLNRGDLLLRLVASIDHPCSKMVIVDNSRGRDPGLLQAIKRITAQHPNATVTMPIRGYSVAESWNHIIRDHPAHYHFILSNDIQFHPGDMDKMVLAAKTQPTPALVFGNHEMAFFIITELAIRAVGYFDENFYPAYFEDCDYRRRVGLYGAPVITLPLSTVHGEPPFWRSTTVHSNPDYMRKNMVTFARNLDYFKRKWGATPKEPESLYLRPFNDPAWPLDKWVLDPHVKLEGTW